MSKLGEVLIKKLTKEELADFCEAIDDGTFGPMVDNELVPKDAENFTEKYVDPE